jgi:hypothetical protein
MSYDDSEKEKDEEKGLFFCTLLNMLRFEYNPK